MADRRNKTRTDKKYGSYCMEGLGAMVHIARRLLRQHTPCHDLAGRMFPHPPSFLPFNEACWRFGALQLPARTASVLRQFKRPQNCRVEDLPLTRVLDDREAGTAIRAAILGRRRWSIRNRSRSGCNLSRCA